MGLKIKVHDLTMQYDAYPILKGVEFNIRRGELVALLGANGAGKSTLLRCISRVLAPTSGSIYLDGRNVQELNSREVAQTMAVVPQETGVDFDFTVEDIVLMGRFPYLGRFQKESQLDREIARKVMEMTGVAHLAHRSVTTLSGGERQRVVIARALCQEPELLLLDEPTANLDIGYQTAILELAAKLNKQKKITIIAAIHDLNLAAQFFDRFILLSSGKVLAAGSAEEVITPENIRESYGVPAIIFRHPLHGRLQVGVFRQPQQPLSKNAGKGGPRVHVIGGGVEALPALEALREKGCRLSVGPVSVQDSSYQYASFYRIPVVKVPPFSAIPDRVHAEHLRLIEKADLVVVPPIPFGEGNLRNLEAVEQALNKGLPVVILEEKNNRERDYTGGRATAILERLKKKGAHQLTEVESVFNYLQ